nr:hypothetical protein [Methylobacterium sp. L1A1]
MSNPPASSPRRPGAFSAARSRVADLVADLLGRVGQAAVLSRLALVPPPPPAPLVDRAALVNYATFLAWERNRVCAELYPHLGTKAATFVLIENAAERFFYPDGVGNGVSQSRRDVPPASTRAVAVLDLVGVDWRSDPPGDGMERSIGARECVDTGERPPVPYGWPAIDATLVEASANLVRLDAGIAALIEGDERDAGAVPGYLGLEDARTAALVTLTDKRAEGVRGLQAKARAILTRGLGTDPFTLSDLGQSLARDLLDIDGRSIEPQPDPIFAALNEARRLEAAAQATEPSESKDDPFAAFWRHWRETVLTTVPTTAAGCKALCRYVVDRFDRDGLDLNQGPGGMNHDVLRLIALSPTR